MVRLKRVNQFQWVNLRKGLIARVAINKFNAHIPVVWVISATGSGPKVLVKKAIGSLANGIKQAMNRAYLIWFIVVVDKFFIVTAFSTSKSYLLAGMKVKDIQLT